MLQQFNAISQNLQFTIEPQVNNKISFLDITIYKTNHNISIQIYRKPTTTDTIILQDLSPTRTKNGSRTIPSK